MNFLGPQLGHPAHSVFCFPPHCIVTYIPAGQILQSEQMLSVAEPLQPPEVYWPALHLEHAVQFWAPDLVVPLQGDLATIPSWHEGQISQEGIPLLSMPMQLSPEMYWFGLQELHGAQVTVSFTPRPEHRLDLYCKFPQSLQAMHLRGKLFWVPTPSQNLEDVLM